MPSETTVEQITPDTTADAPIANALTLIINEAIKARASDIHLQPEEDILRVRYRVDGTLHDTITLPLEISGPLISRIKILAKMNIADQAFRYGGDEFAVLLPNTSIDAASRVAERIRKQVASKVIASNIQITASLGLASWPANGISANEVIKAADVALYNAKRSGGNRSERAVNL